MAVDAIIVTCARTRGSTIKFLPVAAATASVIWVMSASLKFGVMRPDDCWADAMEIIATSSGAQRTKRRKHFTRDSPEAGEPALLRCIRLLGRWRRLRLIRRRCALGTGHSLGFLHDLRYVQCQILLLAAAYDCDVCLTGGTEGAKDVLSASRVIQRSSTDGNNEVAWPQTESRERLAIAPRVHAVAFLLTLRKHRLRSHDVSHQTRILGDEFPHPVHYRCFCLQCGSRRRRRTRLQGPRQHQRLQHAVAVDDHLVGENLMQLRASW